MRLFILFLIATATTLAQDASQDWRESLNQGVGAYKAARYAEAVDAFLRAANLNPNSVTAHLYLATAFMSQYIPGAESPENLDLARRAESEFLAVLRLDATNKTAFSSLASLTYQQAQGMPDLDRKLAKLDEAAFWYLKAVGIDPQDKEAYYSLGVIDWVRWYAAWMRARADLGMNLADPGPLPITAVREQLKEQYLPMIERGISNLASALAMDPQYDDAMAYMNLFVRERADLRDSVEEYRRDIRLADQWVEKALETKRLKAPPETSRAAPPPPAPPPPEPQRIRGGYVQLIRRVEPVYPKDAHVEGIVRFTIIVGTDGHVKNIQLISGHPLLVSAAMEAVRQWEYRPTLINGQPVEVVTSVEVTFALQR